MGYRKSGADNGLLFFRTVSRRRRWPRKVGSVQDASILQAYVNEVQHGPEVTPLMVFLLCLSFLLPATSEYQEVTGEAVESVQVQQQKPCICTKDECNCCAVLNLEKLNFKRTGCIQFKYDMLRSGLNLKALLNNKSLFQTAIQARNPPPICVPLPLAFLRICVRIRDIRWQDQKLHVCSNLELQVNQTPLIVIPFDCVNIGASGIGVDKPTTVASTFPVGDQTL